MTSYIYPHSWDVTIELVLGDKMEGMSRMNNSGMDPNAEPDEKKWLAGIWSVDYYILIYCESIATAYKSKADSIDTKRHSNRHVNKLESEEVCVLDEIYVCYPE